MLWRIPEFSELTEQQWKEGYLEATVLETENENWRCAIERVVPAAEFPKMVRELLWDVVCDSEHDARYFLDQEVTRRNYPRPKFAIVVEE